MIGYWASFSLLLVLIPFGLAGFCLYVQKNSKQAITPEIKQHGNVMVIKFTLFYWLCDLFYMSCFIDNFVCKYVFGSIIIVVMLMNSAMSFLNQSKRNSLERYFLLQDFLIAIGISVYLLYIIPNKELQTILISIASCIIGGMFTLIGVAWTIRKSDKDRQVDEKKKAKPLFTFTMLNEEPENYESGRYCFTEANGNFRCHCCFEIENSNLSAFIFKRIRHDGMWSELVGNYTILPNGKCLLDFLFDSPFGIFLETEDYLGNKHFYQIKVLYIASNGANDKLYHTVRDLREISFEDIEQIEKEDNEK